MNLDKLNGLIVEKHIQKNLLAKELGYSIQNLNKKLSGKGRIYVDEIPVICEVVGIEDDNLKCEIFLN